MRQWRAVVFDLDDTLYPETQYVLSGFRAVARWVHVEHGVPEREGYKELERLFNEGVRGDTFNRWLEFRGLPLDLVPTLLDVYRSHRPVLEPFPGVAELLATLAVYYKVGLVSDGYYQVQKAKFDALGLASLFSVAVFSDAWGRAAWKPSVRPFKELLAQLEMSGHEAVYVADNPLKDFLGARAVGMATIRALHCAGEYARLQAPSREYEPDMTVATLRELSLLLGGGVT